MTDYLLEVRLELYVLFLLRLFKIWIALRGVGSCVASSVQLLTQVTYFKVLALEVVLIFIQCDLSYAEVEYT